MDEILKKIDEEISYRKELADEADRRGEDVQYLQYMAMYTTARMIKDLILSEQKEPRDKPLTTGDKIRESNESLAKHLVKYGILMGSQASEDRLFKDHLEYLNKPLTQPSIDK